MRKHILREPESVSTRPDWLNIEELADVQVTSEESSHPIESAFSLHETMGWRAAGPGKQTIRLHFHHPQELHRISVNFSENENERTQEYLLRWSADEGRTFKDIVRQQWNFSPHGSREELENHHVTLCGVTVLELSIVPDIRGGDTPASLHRLRLR